MIKTGEAPESLDLVVYAESVDCVYEESGQAKTYADYASAWNAFLN
jgi:hypothetical protein